MIQASEVIKIANKIGTQLTLRDVDWVISNYKETPNFDKESIVFDLLWHIPDMTIEEFRNKPDDCLKLIKADIDSSEYSNIFIGEVSAEDLSFSNHINCGHEHDCCGCLCHIYQEAEQITPTLVKITRTYHFNY